MPLRVQQRSTWGGWSKQRSLLVVLVLASLAMATLAGLRRPAAGRLDAPTNADRRELSAHDWSELHGAFEYRTDGGSSFSGRVHSIRGEPIAGARVCATCGSCDYIDLPSSICATSDASGGYTLRADDLRSPVLTATAAGFFEGQANGGLPLALGQGSRAGLDIVLEPEDGSRLVGTIEDALGGIVPGARIQIMRFLDDRSTTVELTSDAEGRFALATRAGALLVRATAEGYSAEAARVVAPSEDVKLVLTPASTIRGRVVVARTGEPAEGVEVKAKPVLGAPRAAGAVSDSDGSFKLSGLDPGSYQLLAHSERFRATDDRTIQVGLATSLDDIVVEVEPAVSVLGHVLIGEGDKPCQRGEVMLATPTEGSSALAKTPVPDEVLAAAAAHPLPSASSNIEADGTVRLKGLTPGLYQASVHCSDYVLAAGPELLEVGEKNLEVVWRMAEGLGFVVHVVDEAGASVPAFELILLTPAQGARAPISLSFFSDESGHAKSPLGLHPGKYRVESSDGQGEPLEVELSPGSATVQRTLRVEGSGYITVKAVDSTQRPVSGLSIAAQAQQPAQPLAQPQVAVEQGRGSYRIGPLRAGNYAVEARDGTNPPQSPEGASGALVQVRSGTVTEATIRMARSGTIRGKVVDERGSPEGSLWVAATHQADSQAGWGTRLVGLEPARVMTDEEGSFTIEGLQVGATYRLRAVQPFESAAVLSGVKTGSEVTLVLPAAASIRGVVAVERGGTLPSAAIVQVHHREAGIRRTARISSSGQFAIDQIPPGRVTVMVAGSEVRSSPQEIELTGGQRLEGLQFAVSRAPALPEETSPPNPGLEPPPGERVAAEEITKSGT
jgi:hypothetical protein